MTTRARIAHWIMLGSIVYCIGGNVAAGLDGNWMEAVAVTVWSFLAFMVYQRPGSWGFGVGLLMLLLIPVQAWLWQLAVTRLSPEQRAAHGVSGSWLSFAVSVLPLLAGGICGLALRRLQGAPSTPPSE